MKDERAWPFATQVLLDADNRLSLQKKIKNLMGDGYRLAPGTIQRVRMGESQFSGDWWFCAMDVPSWKQS